MDMEELLDSLYELTVENDLKHEAIMRQRMADTEPEYERLCAALGDEEGEKIWFAALECGATEKTFIFDMGLCLGMRLMALCL